MSEPRHAFGKQPGRVVAAMLRALAAELSDPGRYSRAKAYARDGAVIEIDIRPQTITGLVLGSRRQPYEVLLAADAASAEEIAIANPAVLGSMTMLVPGREELSVACTCPDATGFGGGLCKHAVALLLVLADETTIEPELLVRWRSPDPDARVRALDAHRLPGRGRTRAPVATRVDVLAGLLDGRRPLPELPRVARRPLPAPPPVALTDRLGRLIHELIADAVAAASRIR
jgi:hypothetical protein